MLTSIENKQITQLDNKQLKRKAIFIYWCCANFFKQKVEWIVKNDPDRTIEWENCNIFDASNKHYGEKYGINLNVDLRTHAYIIIDEQKIELSK